MQSRQGMNKGMQGMRKKNNVNVYTTYGFLTTSKPQLFLFLELLHQRWYECLRVYVPTFEAINN